MHGMRNVVPEDAPSYQQLLRKLGAWLDAASARGVVVREERNGFMVRYERQDIELVFMQRFFTYQELSSLRRGDLRLRRTLVRRIGHRLQGLAGEPGGYQDLFRALGYTLDEVSAGNIQLTEDEPEGKLMLKFRVSEDTTSSDLEEPETVLARDDRDAIRRAARARRGEQGMLRRFR
jgi:hypothetical protein